MYVQVGGKEKEGEFFPSSNRIVTEPYPRVLSPEGLLFHRQKEQEQNFMSSGNSDSEDWAIAQW